MKIIRAKRAGNVQSGSASADKGHYAPKRGNTNKFLLAKGISVDDHSLNTKQKPSLSTSFKN